jgi:hypothetical protein
MYIMNLPAARMDDGEEALDRDRHRGPDGASEGDLHEGEQPGEDQWVVLRLRRDQLFIDAKITWWVTENEAVRICKRKTLAEMLNTIDIMYYV